MVEVVQYYEALVYPFLRLADIFYCTKEHLHRLQQPQLALREPSGWNLGVTLTLKANGVYSCNVYGNVAT
jgi:hypothetical protein